ncbi:MAG: tetratricopeptide repeat protein [Armatimonadota bacterium]|jgi:tetratricopeptide (TPR) repeat protein
MRFRLFVFVLIVVLAAFSVSLFAQSTPQSDPTLDAHVAEAFVEASAAAKSSNHDQAAEIYWSIAERFPDHADAPRAAKQAAYTTDKLGDRDKSIAAFKRALDMYPDSGYAPALKRCLALSYQAKGEKERAIRELDDLISRYPKSDAACLGLINLGLLHIAQVCKQNTDEQNWQRKEEADAAFRRVTETFPDKRDLCAKAEMYRVGIAFERVLAQRSTWDIAAEQIRNVLSTYADAPGAIKARLEIMLAEIAMENGDYQDQARRADALIQAYPQCKLEIGWASLIAGYGYENTGDYATALKRYLLVIEGHYAVADNFKGLDVTLFCLMRSAECHVRTGETAKALDIWQTVLKNYPSSPKASLSAAMIAKYGGK